MKKLIYYYIVFLYKFADFIFKYIIVNFGKGYSLYNWLINKSTNIKEKYKLKIIIKKIKF